MTASPKPVSIWQNRLGSFLMWVAASGALLAFVSGISVVASTTSNVVWLETWRNFGFLMFAGMFALLALRPRLSPGIWELAFFHKATMAISALFLIDVNEAAEAGLIDGILAVMLLIAYLCMRGWRGWSR